MYGHFRRVALTACVFLGASRVPLAGAEVFCRSSAQCKQPDSLTVLLRPGSDEVLLDANFGLVGRAPEGGWTYTCDDIFVERVQYRTQIAPDGRIFVPALDGLHVGGAGCGWTKAGGSMTGQSAHDVAFDRTAPERIWAISGNDARSVALSTDGGKTFVVKHTFADHQRMIRVAVAPSDPKVLYVAGFNGTRVPIMLALSTDGGETWTVDETTWMGVAGPNQIAEFLGVSPDDPHTVYVMVTSGKGDEIWKSTQQGRGLTKVLTFSDEEQWPRGGFSFGADGKTLYVVGFDPLNTGTRPPSSLYLSRDAGLTWERRPSAAHGPRYRCIGFRGGQLYGCGGDLLSGDQFLLGVSSDEGRSWASLVRTSDVRGPSPCVGDMCAQTVDFLRSFADGGTPAVLPDAGPRPPPVAVKKSGCSFGGGPAAGAGPSLLLAAAALLGRRARRWRARA
jgi:hypothetical protein